MANKGHLTLDGIKQIFSFKSALNFGLSENLKSVFTDLPAIIRPNFTPSLSALNPFWISGFVTGDGSFHISINLKNQVLPVMSICLHIRDELLLVKIKEFFGFGRIYLSGETANFKVFRLVDLLSLITHFNSYPVVGFKLYNYKLWVEIINLISAKLHLTSEGLAQIQSLKEKMNKWN
jgi:hypothetical protein